VDEAAPPLPGTGEINEDPRLADMGSGDFSLLSDSPCIDAGNPDVQFNDPDGTRNDMGAIYSPEETASVAEGDPGGEARTWGHVKALFR